MLPSQRNKLTTTILQKLRNQGAPKGTTVDLGLGVEDEIPSEHEDSDYMGTQIKEVNPFMKNRVLKKKKDEEEEEG